MLDVFLLVVYKYFCSRFNVRAYASLIRSLFLRILGFDITRSVAIFLAMSSHVYAEVGLGNYVPADIAIPYRFISQIAPLIFIILFGTMLEIVYYPRWTKEKQEEVASRLFLRAIQCWVLYAISIFVLFIVDDGYSFAFSISCLIFMGNSPYTEILKFYSVALALAPVVLWARGRFGLIPLVVISVLFQSAWPIFNSMPDAYSDLGIHLQIARFIKFITGFGSPMIAGPSLLHGITLIIAGQCLGKLVAWSLKEEHSERSLTGFSNLSTEKIQILLMAMIALAVGIAVSLPSGWFLSMADMSFRIESNFIYFLLGAIFAFFASLVFVWVVDIKLYNYKNQWIACSFFGRTSLFTFSWGNILLYLNIYEPKNEVSSFIFYFVLIACVCFMSLLFDTVVRKSSIFKNGLLQLNLPLKRSAQRLARYIY
ncbi:hypothetical protein [Paracoccus sp. JM45]|uniref:hypothetical protein n=1 Tax=Paracoccus sp. JM45 TaxID=2283626 RepID=UPI001C71D9AE|nr:hypothetical protein [Paracoccus sp. JM45]